MLYNKYLDIFIACAEAGSFTKAAEALHVTPSALIKQVSAFEEDLGIVLFERTHRGLVLSEAGRSLYDDGLMLRENSRQILRRAREKTGEYDDVIRIGISPVTPAAVFNELWPLIYPHWPELKFQMIPFSNTNEEVSRILANLGDEIDIVGGVFDETLLRYRGCQGFRISRKKIQVCVSMHHPLAKKEKLSMRDLENNSLFLLSEGKMGTMDAIRSDLQEFFPQIHLIDFDYYGMDVFNRCANDEAVLVTNADWVLAHPLLKLMEVEWSYDMPFGILYSKVPSRKVKRFLNLIEDCLPKGIQ